MAVNQDPRDLVFRNAKLIYRNFSGRKDQYNREGQKSFCVVLDPETAERLAKDGWNIRWPEPREDGTVLDPYMNVTVSYKLYKPPITLIGDTTNTRVMLDEDGLHKLDFIEIAKCDFIVDPSVWSMADKGGIKAYLKKMYITMVEDELDIEYGQLDGGLDQSNDEHFFEERD